MGWRNVVHAFQQLPLEEQRLALEELSSTLHIDVALEAWCDQDFVPASSSQRPKRRSWRVPLRWATTAIDETSVTGCPWCRRPVTVGVHRDVDGVQESDPSRSSRFAYATLLYGPQCHSYFLGALVLGEGLQRFGGGITALLLHTADVPQNYLEALASAVSSHQVQYLSKVSWSLFKNWKGSRFIDVFTKLRVLEQEDFEKVLFLDLDLLVRDCGTSLAKLFQLRAPAAMKRGAPIPSHGARVPYAWIWGHPTRRQGDLLPQHQQASGINAGVMLLKPDRTILNEMISEVHDYDHPQHYGTYMPEQEYMSRFYGTFDQWTHLSCNFNFEIDKNEPWQIERIPHDFTEAHAARLWDAMLEWLLQLRDERLADARRDALLEQTKTQALQYHLCEYLWHYVACDQISLDIADSELEDKMDLLRRLAADAEVRVAARKSQGQNEMRAAQLELRKRMEMLDAKKGEDLKAAVSGEALPTEPVAFPTEPVAFPTEPVAPEVLSPLQSPWRLEGHIARLQRHTEELRNSLEGAQRTREAWEQKKALENSQRDHATEMILQEAWRMSRQLQTKICTELHQGDAAFSTIQAALIEACPLNHFGNCSHMKNVSITGLQQVRNPSTWKDYEFRKDQIRKELEGRDSVPAVTSGLPSRACSWAHLEAKINEILVIHGTTDDKIDQIANFGFDERLARESGLYGQGVYFTDQSCKSLQYSGAAWQNSGCFIIARVILGHPNYAEGPLKQLKVEPLVDPTMPCKGRCHSVIAEPGTPTGRQPQVHREFVLFNGAQAYPEMIVHFCIS
eukprot:Skav216299  [mRNA]  locus=scaffold494:135540:149103:- [translate_table: standard]